MSVHASVVESLSFEELLQALATKHEEVLLDNATLRQGVQHGGDTSHTNGNHRSWAPSTVVDFDTGHLPNNATYGEGCTDISFAPEQSCAVVAQDTARPRGSSSSNHDEDGSCRASSSQTQVAEIQLTLLPSESPRISKKTSRLSPWRLALHQTWLGDGAPEMNANLSHSQGTSVKRLSSHVIRGGDTLRDTGCMQCFILRPNSFLRVGWDLVSCFILSIDIIMVPLIAFGIPNASDKAMKSVGLACTGFWTLDVPMSLLSGFYFAGAVEMRPRKVATHYIRTWFLFDICVVTMDWMMLALGTRFSEVVGVFRIFRITRFARALRFCRLIRLLKVPAILDDALVYCRSESLWTAASVFRSLLIIAVVNHFVACGWYAVGKLGSPCWVDRLDMDSRDLLFRYTTSLHWSLTQFTPASMEIYPRNSLERVYSIIVLFLALVVFSSFVSTITNSMNHLRQVNLKIFEQRKNLKRFIHENRLSLELGNRIQAFARHHSIRTITRVHEIEVDTFKVLPESLRLQLHWEVYVPILSTNPFLFNVVELYETFVLDVCSHGLQDVTLTQAQELFANGQSSAILYFLISGSLEYYHGTSEIETVLVFENSWICEVALWLQWVHQGRLSAMKLCEFIAIDASTFRKFASHVPGLFEVCKIYAASFYAKAASLLADAVHPLDVWCDQDVVQEMAQLAFDSCPDQDGDDESGPPSKAPHPNVGRGRWHTFSLARSKSSKSPNSLKKSMKSTK